MVHAAETVSGAGLPKHHRVEVDDHPEGGGDRKPDQGRSAPPAVDLGPRFSQGRLASHKTSGRRLPAGVFGPRS